MRAYHRPEDCSPRSLLSRRLAASPAETLRQRLHGRVHFPPASLADYSSARFACPPSRENLRAGFPCALGHPWLVTLAPANWGPVSFRTCDVRHRGCEDYAGRTVCLENKLCTNCANALEIERVFFSRLRDRSQEAMQQARRACPCADRWGVSRRTGTYRKISTLSPADKFASRNAKPDAGRTCRIQSAQKWRRARDMGPVALS